MITELNVSINREDIWKFWKDQIREELIRIAPQWNFYVKWLICSFENPDTLQMLQEVLSAIEMDGCCYINSPEEMLAMSRLLEFNQPKHMVVKPRRNVPLPKQLPSFLEAIQKYYHGSLKLMFFHSYRAFSSCDEFIIKLKNARLGDLYNHLLYGLKYFLFVTYN